VYCIFTQLTNSNVLGKFPIRDSINREITIGGFGKKYNTHVTVKDRVYDYVFSYLLNLELPLC
jgi:hypothetical protein